MKRIFSFKHIYLSISLLCFILIAYKAFVLSFTHDEALSYFLSKNIDFVLKKSSNIHYLNSLWLFLAQNISKNELWLRLPNVLSFLLYAFAIYRLIQKREKNPLIIKMFAVLFIFNPLQMEFFSLARGYGMSGAFLVWSLCYLIELPDNTKNFEHFYKNFVQYTIFALLALYSNFTVLNFVILGLSLYAYVYWKQYRHHTIVRTKKVKIYILSSFFLFALYRIFVLKRAKELYYGADNLVEGLYLSIKEMTYSSNSLLWYVVTGFLCLVFVLFIWHAYTHRKQVNDSSLILFLLYASPLMMLIQGLVFNNKYFLNRTALPYFIVYGIAFYFVCYDVYLQLKNKKIIQHAVVGSLFLFSVMLTYNHVKYFSLNKTKLWEYDYQTKTVMQIIKNRINSVSHASYTISNHWLFTFAINFYIEKYNLSIPFTDKSGIKEGSTYIYTYNSDKPPVQEYIIITQFPDISTFLLEKKPTIK